MTDRRPGDRIKPRTPIADFLEDPESFGAVLTGSRVFGVSGDLSDTDIFLTRPIWDKVFPEGSNTWSLPVRTKDYPEGEFSLMRFEYQDVSYDVMLMSRAWFKAWAFATSSMLILLEAQPTFKRIIRDKAKRVSIFEAFKTASYQGEKN